MTRPFPISNGGTMPFKPNPWTKMKNRSEEHTSELQSLAYLVCRLLLEKKKTHKLSLRGFAYTRGLVGVEQLVGALARRTGRLNLGLLRGTVTFAQCA